MDLVDRLNELASRAAKLLPSLKTEEATKNALVMPFIQALGYNVFDPSEVVPEFTADVGTKKGEKVDYAVIKDSKPIILFECKWCGDELKDSHASQLYRYFSVTAVRFAVLTNGIQYRIYSDLEQPNKMDSKPFLEFSLTSLTPAIAAELKKFAKDGFDLDKILETASDLKYTKGIKRILGDEAANPSDEMVRILTGRVYSGNKTQAVKDQFTKIVRLAFQEFVNDRVNEVLKSALQREESGDGPKPPVGPSGDDDRDSDGDVVTTEEEKEGFLIVRGIVREVLDAKRVVMRDSKSYCAILIDDNNRKPLCRLHFNTSQKYLGLFDAEKKETRKPISDLSEIYGFAAQLKEAAARFKGG